MAAQIIKMYRAGTEPSDKLLYLFYAEIHWSIGFWFWKDEFTRPIYSDDGRVWWFVTNPNIPCYISHPAREYFGHPIHKEATKIASYMMQANLSRWTPPEIQHHSQPSTF